MQNPAAVRNGQSNEADGEPRTLAEAVYRRLRNDILWGKLRPGTALKSDELRKNYSIGISPLREALSRLTSERLVTASGQRGFRVAPLTSEDVRDTMETRIVIEREALTRSIEVGDITWEKDIVASFHALSRIPIPESQGIHAETWAKHHRDFHMALLAACGSRWQSELAALLFDQADRHRSVSVLIVTLERVQRDANKEHKEMMEAALARDASSAVKLLDLHYRTTAELLISVLERNSRELGRKKIGAPEVKSSSGKPAKRALRGRRKIASRADARV
jgi:DNA-binding GntR family transcriptional regulator